MKREQLLALLAKILPETVEFELRDQKRGSGNYGIANFESKTRSEFSVQGIPCEGNPKFTLIFGMATPKGIKPVAKAKTNQVSDLAAWKSKFA